MKKLLSIILSLLLLLLVVCGCDNNGKDDNSKPTTTSSESTDNTSSEDMTSSEETVSSESTSTEDGSDSDTADTQIITPIDTPSEEDASSGGTSTSSSDKTDEEEEGEKPLRERLKGGINFEDLQTGSKAYTSYVYQRKYWDLVAEAGFDNVRLPVQLHSYVVSEGPEYLLDTEAMRWLDVAINHGLDAGLVVVLDFHHSNYKTDPECFKRVWEQVAERYRDYPEELFFEIVNEPNGTSHDYFNNLQTETVEIIRKTNPKRCIVFSVNWVNHWKALWHTEIPEGEENIMLSIHNYVSMGFTHGGMGAKYGDKVPLTDDILKDVTYALEQCADYEARTGRQIWISEWGAYQGARADDESMSKYYKHFTSECARLGLAYAVWEFNHGFGVYDWDNQEWNSYLLDSMVIQW